MIVFGESRFLAVSVDLEGAYYSPVRGNGFGHMLTLGEAARPGTDVRDFADDGKVLAVCGRALKADNLAGGLSRTVCPKCSEFEQSDAYRVEVERTRGVYRAAVVETRAASLVQMSREIEARKAERANEAPAPEESVSPDVAMVVCTGTGKPPVEGSRRTVGGKSVARCGVCLRDDAPVNKVANGKVRSHMVAAPEIVEESAETTTITETSLVQEGTAEEGTKSAPAEVQEDVTPEESAPVVEVSGEPESDDNAEDDSAGESGTGTVKVSRKGREIDAVARETDGKCAYAVVGEDGSEKLVTVHGRSGILPVPGTVSLGIDGGEVGVCSICRTEVKLTGLGAVPTHRPGGVTPDGPVLTQKSVPAVENGNAVADTAKKRESEAYEVRDESGETVRPKDVKKRTKSGEKLSVVPVVPTAPDAGAAVGSRDHGRLDGVAMAAGDLSPVQPTGKGWAAKAGTMALPVGRAKPDRQVVADTVGGTCGYLSGDVYRKLSKTRRRRYWKHVATNKDRAAQARKIVSAKSEAMGERLPAGVRRELRKGAKVGSSAEGTVHGRVFHADAA